MKVAKHLFYILFVLSFTACIPSAEQKMFEIINADEIFIQKKTFDSKGDYSKQKFHYKNTQSESVMIIEEATVNQKIVDMTGKVELFKTFLNESYQSNEVEAAKPDSIKSNLLSEYTIRTGFYTLVLSANEKCDSLFNLINN